MNEILAANPASDLPCVGGAEAPISSPDKTSEINKKENSSSDEDLDVFCFKRRRGRIMNSDNESDHSEGSKGSENHIDKNPAATTNNLSSIDANDSSGDNLSIFKRKPLKTRITNKSSSDEEPSKARISNKSSSSDDSSSNEHESTKKFPKKTEDSRIQSKQNKMKAKFSGLLLSRDKERTENRIDKIVNSSSSDSSDNEGHSEMFSIENIKKVSNWSCVLIHLINL